MSVIIRRTFVWGTMIAVVAVALVLGRNYQLDSAAADIKHGSGVMAIEKLKPLAALGDRNAQVLLGYAYAYGWAGIVQNDDEAMQWFSRRGLFGSREPGGGGEPGATEALSVAKAYAAGSEGVSVDPQKSRKWLLLAASAGNREAAELSKRP